MTSALPVQCSNQLSYEVTQLHDHSPVLHNNDYNNIRDYMEGHTLLPITTVHDVDAKPGPASRHRDAVSTSGSLQVDSGSCEVQSSSSVAYQTVPNLSLLRVVVPGMKILCLPLFSVKYQINCPKKGKSSPE